MAIRVELLLILTIVTFELIATEARVRAREMAFYEHSANGGGDGGGGGRVRALQARLRTDEWRGRRNLMNYDSKREVPGGPDPGHHR